MNSFVWNQKAQEKAKSDDSRAKDNELIPIQMKEEGDIKVELDANDGVSMITSRGDFGPINVYFVDDNDQPNIEDLCATDVKLEFKAEAEIDSKVGMKSKEGEQPDGNNISDENICTNHPSKKGIAMPRLSIGKSKKKGIALKGRAKAVINAAYREQSAAKRHKKQHKCTTCGYVTPWSDNLKRHMRKHTGEKPFPCNICNKRFSQKSHLQGHLKTHTDDKHLFRCSLCLKQFARNDEKSEHEAVCNGRRFECHLCKKSSTIDKFRLKIHMRVHSGVKPFECKECFKQFARKDCLNRHMKLHGGPRSFRCSKCCQGFLQQDERNVHEEKCTRHAYECDICGKTFGSYKSHLIGHMRTHSGEKPFQCKDCPKKFTLKSNLKNHMKIHTKKLQSKCLICRQGFTKESMKKAHQRNCNGRYYECYLCKSFFNLSAVYLKAHMYIHSGEKSFQCELCRKTYTQKYNLNRHMKNIHNKKH